VWCDYLNLAVFLFWGKKFGIATRILKIGIFCCRCLVFYFLIKEILVFEKNVITLLNFWGKLWIFFLKKFTNIY